jgi:hypothetical protein
VSRHLERRRTRSARTAILLLGVGTALLLPGCSDPQLLPDPLPTATAAPSATAAPTPSATDSAAGGLVSDGTAGENLPLFEAVTAAVWASPEQVSGRAYIDALVAAGFDKSAMQVTPDQTTVGNPAESIQFSVRWGEECLVGQVGPTTGAPVAIVVPVLAEGTCLVGETRPIDW